MHWCLPGAIVGIACAVLAARIAMAPQSSRPQPRFRAVAWRPVEPCFVKPSASASVATTLVMGTNVEIQDEQGEPDERFARIRTPDGYESWIRTPMLRRLAPSEPDYAAGAGVVEIRSNVANVYRTPSFEAEPPAFALPIGVRLEADAEPVAASDGAETFWRVSLPHPDGPPLRAFLAAGDAARVDPRATPPIGSPADWVSMGRRFVGAPYTWGGTTPFGFDCSGFTQCVFARFGVALMRDAYQQCFQDPSLVAAALDAPQPGDLLFFGSETRISHVALAAGGGEVLHATRVGRPCVQATRLDDAALRPRLRYARRLRAIAKDAAPRPRPAALAALQARLEAIRAESGLALGLAFHDLATGEVAEAHARDSVHAASTMKTAVMLEVLRRVDRGELSLEQPVAVANEFKSLADGSSFAIALDPDTDGAVASYLGRSAPLGFLVREMMTVSSNLATNVVMGLVGAEAVQRNVCDAIGAASVRVRRGVEDARAFEKGVNNETDAAGMARVMEACARDVPGLALSKTSREFAWRALVDQRFRDQIPAGLHPQSGARVGHKTGLTSSVEHDAAVIELPDGRRYVLVTLASGLEGDAAHAKAREASRLASRAAWDHVIAP